MFVFADGSCLTIILPVIVCVSVSFCVVSCLFVLFCYVRFVVPVRAFVTAPRLVVLVLSACVRVGSGCVVA